MFEVQAVMLLCYMELAQDITRDCKVKDVDITCSHIFLLRNSGLDVCSATNAYSITQVGASCACLKSQGDLATVPRVLEKMRTYYYFLPYENPWVHLLCLQHLWDSVVWTLTVLCSYTSLSSCTVAEDGASDWMQPLNSGCWIHPLGNCFLPWLCELFQTSGLNR